MGARLGFALLGAGILQLAAPAAAQTVPGGVAERPSDALSRNLRSLSANPKSLSALMGAGTAALSLGDPQAAVTFFARAEEVAPRDGRIKMWIGSALVQLQQPRAAMKFFKEAVDLGVAEAEVAGDRGLAHDILGEGSQAQRDYRLALTRGRNEELTRRLALSMAIGGQREPALQLLSSQLASGDRSAERTRTFILALTGDTHGAARAAEGAMGGAQASAMAGFLDRLPSLAPAERALAVHLGVFPRAGSTAAPAYAARNTPPVAASTTDAGRPDSRQPSLARQTKSFTTPPAAKSDKPTAAPALSAAIKRPEPVPSSSAQPSAPPASGTTPSVAAPFSIAAPSASSSTVPVVIAERPVAAEPQPTTAAPVPSAASPTELAGATAATTQPKPAEAQPSGSRLADLASALEGIREKEPTAPAAKPAVAPAKPAAKAATPTKTAAATTKPAATATKPAAKPIAGPAAAKKPAAPAEQSRHWVQVAGGADKTALPRTFATLKGKAPKLLATRSAWTTPLNATNRLLVGPFDSAKAAQEFVNALKESDVSAFAWQSPAGQKIEKLPAK
jgi:Flp pilus assembly protein TadD